MPTTEPLVLAEESHHRRHHPHSRRARRLAGAVLGLFVLGLVVAGVFGLRGLIQGTTGARCQATALGQSVDFDPGQTAYAATITGIAVKRRLPARAATIALATAIQESKLRNLTYGDRDSLGLFQQRPSQGWGTEKQILDPVHATNRFYDELVKVRGYETMPITKVAQEVQKSAFPEAYAEHEREGRVLASTLSGHSPGGLGCRLDDPTGPGDARTLVSALATEMGVRGSASGRSVTVTGSSAEAAWSVGEWAVAKAGIHGVTRVQVADRQWTRTLGKSGWSWQPVRTRGAETVTITLAP